LREQQAADEAATAAKAAAMPTADEAFKLEVLRRYEREELSEASMIEIIARKL